MACCRSFSNHKCESKFDNYFKLCVNTYVCMLRGEMAAQAPFIIIMWHMYFYIMGLDVGGLGVSHSSQTLLAMLGREVSPLV